MDATMRVRVTGAGGFIGSHLVTALKRQGHWVRRGAMLAIGYQPAAFV